MNAPAQSLDSFDQLGLTPGLLRATRALGFIAPTPVQSASLPDALRGRDVIACAPTGSGKTAAFGLALLNRLDTVRRPAWRRTYALVLVPTRELALQVGETMQALARHMNEPVKVSVVFGGVSVNPQMIDLRRGAEVIVATPGRLLDLVERNAVHLEDVAQLVLDEADRMLDEGFADELARIMELVPAQHQTLLFSATFPDALRAWMSTRLRGPAQVDIPSVGEDSQARIEQRAMEVDESQRTPLLRHLIESQAWPRVLVFVATRYACEHVADKLRRKGFSAASLHGDLSQGARTHALQAFHQGEVRVLLATDMAARGLHIPGLPVVVNYDLPRSTADYIHRIGRTARAGASGLAVSFITAAQQAHWRLIEKRHGLKLERERIAGFEPQDAVWATPVGEGGIKGRRKSKKDKAREALKTKP
jgi:superfamily II DNA/RNA helicase